MDGNLPVAVAHPGAPRPQGPPNGPNVFANLFNGQGPVYQPGSGLAASASHVIENTVEYAPDASGSLGAASPVPPQINGQGVNGPHPPPSAPGAGAVIPSQFQGTIFYLSSSSSFFFFPLKRSDTFSSLIHQPCAIIR